MNDVQLSQGRKYSMGIWKDNILWIIEHGAKELEGKRTVMTFQYLSRYADTKCIVVHGAKTRLWVVIAADEELAIRACYRAAVNAMARIEYKDWWYSPNYVLALLP